MNNHLLSLLNPTETIKEKLPLIIEAFVKYYGEDMREEITSKFNQVFIVGYQNINDTKRILDDIKNNKENELLSALFSKYGLEFSKETKQVFLQYEKMGKKNTPIDNCGKLIIKQHLGIEGRHQQFIKQNYEFLKKYYPTLTIDTMMDYSKNGIPDEFLNSIPNYIKENINYYFDINQNAEEQFKKEIHNCLPLLNMLIPDLTVDDFYNNSNSNIINNVYQDYLQCIEEYNMYMSQFESYQNKVDFAKNLHDNLEKKYTIQFIDEFIDTFSIQTKEKYQIEKTKEFFSLSEFPEIKNIFGYNFNSTPTIQAFSDENQQLLDNIEESSWKKQSVIDDRIKYFKNIGLDLGNNYDDYLNSLECQRMWPKHELIERVIQTKEKYLNLFYKEYYNSIPSYQSQRNEIDSLGLLDKEDAFTINIYQNPITCVNPNIKLENGIYKEQNLMLINSTLNDPYLDKNIIHEFNHLFELKLSSVSQNSYEMICGWDLLSGDINQTTINAENKDDMNQSKRNYELFNEIINETIAQEISNLMHEQGIYLFNTEDKHSDFGGTSYQKSLCLVHELLETYKTEIIESRRNGNIERIFDVIGRENFEQLNNLVNKFNKIFPEFKYYKLIGDLKENKDTELTQTYYKIINEKNEIMEHIQTYTNAKSL